MSRIVLLLMAVMCSSSAIAGVDHTKVVGPDACADCHSAEVDVWAESTHFRTYEELSQSDEALDIADRLGVDDIEAPDGTCVSCHFTLTGETFEDAEPIAGISCESCHGAALDWIDSHGQYPGDGPESETGAQQQARIAQSESAGQIRPQRIHLIAENCMDCHTVPNEELVNVGGHPAGSDFELVSWLDGEVRHNLFWSNGEENTSSPVERKRTVYVVGVATDLEYSMRALALSQTLGTYRTAMQARVADALAKLKQIAGTTGDAQIKQMLASAGNIDPAALDAAALTSAAGKLAAASKAFVDSGTGAQLTALDDLIPDDGHYSDKY